MKKNCNTALTGLIICLLTISPLAIKGQSEKAFMKKYLTGVPPVRQVNKFAKYRMTAVYTNRDLYGKFTGKTKVSGDYTRGFSGDSVSWSNVYISVSNNFSEPFPAGKKQEYMENMKYVPSLKMLGKESFKNFPAGPESVFARNLVWDMHMIETYAWSYNDSLKLNDNYVIYPGTGSFDMAGIGNYAHDNIQIRWTGISEMNNELCAVIEYRAIDNLLEINMDMITGKGTEQYWGTTWISMKTGTVEYADTYSGTIQEIQVKGMSNKFLVKTIREISVDRIQ